MVLTTICLGFSLQKTMEALQAEEDKVNHLSKVKAKLESSIDEVSTCFWNQITNDTDMKQLIPRHDCSS